MLTVTMPNGWHVEWSDDWAIGSHLEEYGEAYAEGEPDTCETATLFDASGEIVGSLCCIDDADDDYRAVIESDLVADALAHRAIIHGRAHYRSGRV